MSAETKSGWHLDRRVPIALVFALLFQAIAVVWWGSKLDSRVEIIETVMLTMDVDGTKLAREQIASMRERTLVLETRLTAMQDTLSRIERLIEAKAKP